ncbi:hypothetical protein RUM44_004429 [Polyplax serrata]|uniref:sphinganine-1-phosphate aldolase n=1 Tax=Polyplax serrata TaxID=468196 RepID=A0ABR1B4N5_POLSC
MALIKSQLIGIKGLLNDLCKDKEPWQIIVLTASTVLTVNWLLECLSQEINLLDIGKKKFFKLVKKIPSVRNKIGHELSKIKNDFESEVRHRNEEVPYITELPNKGMTNQEILKLVETYLKLGDYKWENGYVSGAVYYHNNQLIQLLTQVYGKASYTNPLHPEVFPGICKMEAEVVRITINLFNGGPESCGTMTTGGTESILMAVKAYRDYAIFERGIRHPNIVVPSTAHPAFDKAAQYLKIKIIHVKIDSKTTSVDIAAMKKAITNNTCLLVGSVPNFPYGTMDDIQSIAALGLKYNIPVHVDACLGGFVIAFMEKVGFQIPTFDFRIKGVTSISADTHKYGCAPKGSSVILYKFRKFLHHQYTVTTDWNGGVYGSPTVNGSRAGGIIAACWATLMHFGLDGYLETTKAIIQTTKYIENELKKLHEIFVFGSPISSVIALGSNTFHIYRLSEALSKCGWNLNPLQYPPGIHLCITNLHTQKGVAETFINDVKSSIKEIMKNPDEKVEGKMAMYGVSASIPDRSIVGDITRLFLDSMYYIPEEELKKTVDT